MDTALHTLDEVDGVLWLLDAHGKIKQEEERIAETLRGVQTPVLILLNKIDLVSKGKLLPLIERCAQLLPEKEIVPVSALRGEGVDVVLKLVEGWLPEGPRILRRVNTPINRNAFSLRRWSGKKYFC